MTDRIPCINPRCRRTASADEYEPGTQIICGRCFRNLPRELRERHKRHRRRFRRLERLVEKRTHKGTIQPHVANRVMRNAISDWDRNWDRIRKYYQEPVKPEGLDGFLEEMGWA